MRDILTLHPARPDSHFAMIWEHMSSGSTDHDVTPAHHSRTPFPLPPPDETSCWQSITREINETDKSSIFRVTTQIWPWKSPGHGYVGRNPPTPLLRHDHEARVSPSCPCCPCLCLLVRPRMRRDLLSAVFGGICRAGAHLSGLWAPCQVLKRVGRGWEGDGCG